MIYSNMSNFSPNLWVVLTYDLLEADALMTSLTVFVSSLYKANRFHDIDSMALGVSLIRVLGCQNMARTSVTCAPNSLCATFVFLQFHIVTSSVLNVLLNRCTATWNLFVEMNVLAGENDNRQCNFISGVLHAYWPVVCWLYICGAVDNEAAVSWQVRNRSDQQNIQSKVLLMTLCIFKARTRWPGHLLISTIPQLPQYFIRHLADTG